MPDRATNEPSELRAGITWEWEREFSDYPASTWTLKYWFKQLTSSGANFSITATADGSKHVVSVAAATTAGYTAGDYSWVAVATSGAEARELDKGTMKVLPRYDQAQALDDRSHARTMLDLIETALEAFAANPVMKSYTIGTRAFERNDIKELLELRDKYKAEVHREVLAENARNGMEGGKLVVRL